MSGLATNPPIRLIHDLFYLEIITHNFEEIFPFVDFLWTKLFCPYTLCLFNWNEHA